MEPSPLTQVSRPDSFQPKIVRLYETLFREDSGNNEDEIDDLSEGFWEEFFLHRPDGAGLRRILGALSVDDMLQLQTHSQQLVLRAISRIKQRAAPSDETALDTLTAFVDAALSKRYLNPSSDIISLIAGLHDADAVMSDLVATLDTVMRSGRNLRLRLKAVRTTLSIAASTFHTGLPSYFTHRDLFPSLMKYIHDCQESAQITPAFFLLGLLVNYNKFEFQNPYKLRLDDFVNDAIMQKMVNAFAAVCSTLRDSYVAVQDDMPEGWTLGSTLSYMGLGVLATGSRPSSPAPAPEETRSLFTTLPGPEIGVLLSTYDFAHANKLFCFKLLSLPTPTKADTPPLAAFLSLTSYLLQHAHRSDRSSLYTYLCLFILQILVEDQVLIKRLCSNEGQFSVRLCRQRQPYLPITKGDRIPVCMVLDLMVDGINHNLRRRLDVELYMLCLGVIIRILSFLSRAKTRMFYHWSELWRTLLSFVRFLTTYVNDITSIHGFSEMMGLLINLLCFALSAGETFLPDPASYDDLFYKLIEAGDILIKFRDAFGLSNSSASNSIRALIEVSSHYRSLLVGKEREKLGSKHLSPREVSSVIKQGYDTLSIEAGEDLDRWDRFREADFKLLLKKIAKISVNDAKILVSRE